MAVVRFVDRFSELILTANNRTARALDASAARIETGAKARSRVDTGAMRGAWTTERVGLYARMVYNPIHYTIFHEEGTVHMPPQPMLRPAYEEEKPRLVNGVRVAWYGGV